MGPSRVEVLEREAAFQGYFRIDRYRLRHDQYGGGLGAPVLREVFERGEVAAVLPLDPVAGRLVLIEQFRPGAWARGWHPWLLECVAGVIEEGESAEALCRREAMEEAGCELLDMVPIAAPFLTSPGASTEAVSLYCARIDSAGVGGIHGLADEGEDIKVTTFSIDEALGLLDAGRIVNAKTIIALQWLALNRETLLERWS